MNTDELEKLLAAATPGPWTHASDKLAAGNIKAPDNAALIVAAVNALPGLLEGVKRYEAALKKIDAGHLPDLEGKPDVLDYAIATRVFYMKLARAALNQEPGQ